MYQIIEAATKRVVISGLTLNEAARTLRSPLFRGHYFVPMH